MAEQDQGNQDTGAGEGNSKCRCYDGQYSLAQFYSRY